MKLLKTLTFPLLSIAILAVVFLFSSEMVLAQSPSTGAAGGFVPCSGSDCTFCHFIQLGNNILNWLFTIVFVIFGVIMVVAGFNLVTSGGNRSKLDDAKKKLSNALIGILIMFAAWLLVDTLMKATLDQSFGPWNQISCEGGQAAYQQVAPGTASGGGSYALGQNCTPNLDGTQTCTTYSDTPIEGQTCEPNQPPLTTGYTCTDVRPLGVTGGDATEVRNTLANANISVNKDECPAGVRYQDVPGGCTSVGGLTAATTQALLDMRNQCGSACSNFTVTGGSELGHTGGAAAGHGAGRKFDLRTSDVQGYIMGPNFVNGTDAGGRSGRVNTALGVVCVREDAGTSNDHWDCGKS